MVLKKKIIKIRKSVAEFISKHKGRFKSSKTITKVPTKKKCVSNRRLKNSFMLWRGTKYGNA
jgi:hypothetical protein